MNRFALDLDRACKALGIALPPVVQPTPSKPSKGK